jgi:hypothetical protein
MSPDNAKKFSVEVPQIGKTLTFKACVACQEKARTNTLYICLGCKSISWYPAGNFYPSGVNYNVKFQCNSCVTQVIYGAFTPEAAQV